jgi:hypothetical protein
MMLSVQLIYQASRYLTEWHFGVRLHLLRILGSEFLSFDT